MLSGHRASFWVALGLAASALAAGCGSSVTAGSGASAGASSAQASSGSHAAASSGAASATSASTGPGGSSTTASATTSSSGGATSTTAAASSSTGSGGCGQCGLPTEMCCAGACVATYNDINNCGGCGNKCTGGTPYCDNGTCTPLPACMLQPGMECNAIGAFCCGTTCCAQGQICCTVESNLPMQNPQCADPVNGTCPMGCPGCP